MQYDISLSRIAHGMYSSHVTGLFAAMARAAFEKLSEADKATVRMMASHYGKEAA